MAAITVNDDRLTVRFDSFGLDAYETFLRCKRLPEYQVAFLPETEHYEISAPARFASLLGVDVKREARQELPLSAFLLDDQDAIVRMALDAKRFACWSDCGLGKTLIMLEFARHVMHRTAGRVLIVTLNDIVSQTIAEAAKFYGESMPIVRLYTRRGMREWCQNGPGQLAITNYEKWNPEDLDHQVVSEAKHLAGIILDESSRLKTGGGKQKWALIKSCRGIEYKLSCTATPAPNDIMEFASQASFLEKLRDEGEILWTYFQRDSKTQKWTVKPHARKAFFEFMASWSIYVRNPKRYGWRLTQPEIPEPVILVHGLEMTPEQIEWLDKLNTEPNGQMLLPGTAEESAGIVRRGKWSQLAKGFVYRKGIAGEKVVRVPSRKPEFVGSLIASEVAAGHQVLVWTVFDAESTILAERLAGRAAFAMITGKTKDEDRLRIMERFRGGEVPVLISRASMLGYGQNLQCATSMIFSGWTDSYESYYQAIRRAYRYGQTERLRVHLPVIPGLEDDMLDNVWRKQAEHEAAIAEMEANYIHAKRREAA